MLDLNDDGELIRLKERKAYGTPADRTVALDDYASAYEEFHGLPYHGDLRQLFEKTDLQAIEASTVALVKRADVLRNARAS